MIIFVWNCGVSLGILASVDDLGEGWLQGGTANEEAIDIFHANELGSIGIGDRSTVEDSSFGSGIGGNIGLQPCSNLSMSLPSNLWRGSLTRTNGPHWLIGDNNLGPVFTQLSNCIQLSLVDSFGLAALSFFEELTDACKHAHTGINCKLGFHGDIGITLSVQGSSL